MNALFATNTRGAKCIPDSAPPNEKEPRMVGSKGVVLIPVAAVVLVRRIRLFRVQRIEEWPAMCVTHTGPALWMEPTFREFLRGIGPSVAAAIVAGGGAAALVGGNPVSAGLMLAAAVTVPAWRWPMADRAGQKSGWGVETVLAVILIVMTANWAAHSGPGIPEARVPRPPPVSALVASHPGTDLSSVILTLPTKPREKTLPPLPMTLGGQAPMTTRPVRIEFDGVYWYFKAPDRRPPRDAKVVKGDPMRARIRSTDIIPIQMEAHQRLPDRTSMDRFREILVRMRDGDNVPGLIRVSLLLEGKIGTEPLLLATQVLESSRSRRGYETQPAVEEELRFPVSPAARGRDWEEMMVRVEPERGRAQAGAHVAVVDFLLQP